MFELQKLLPPSEKRLALATKQGNPIENSVAPVPSAKHIADYERDRRVGWSRRKNPCGAYNCHGHVFAARRTSIYPDPEIWGIIREDGYRKLNDSENVQPDDIACYFTGDGHFVHVARVMEVSGVGIHRGNSQQFASRLLSKWNDSSGEDFHTLGDVRFPPYEYSDLTVQLFTDRPL